MKRLFFLSLFAFFLSCEKEQTPASGNAPVVSDISIEIGSPKEGGMLPEGADTVVHIVLMDKLSLHEYTVSIDDSSGTNYFYEEGHSHQSRLVLHRPWKNTAPAGTSLVLQVKVSNHKNDVLEAKAGFRSVP